MLGGLGVARRDQRGACCYIDLVRRPVEEGARFGAGDARRRCQARLVRTLTESIREICGENCAIAVRGAGPWCSFSLLGLRYPAKSPMRGSFSMSTHRRLGHAGQRTSGTAGGAHRAHSTRTVRAWAARGILALALGLGGLGAATAASPGHGSAGHAPARAHQQAGTHALPAPTGPITIRMPWMY